VQCASVTSRFFYMQHVIFQLCSILMNRFSINTQLTLLILVAIKEHLMLLNFLFVSYMLLLGTTFVTRCENKRQLLFYTRICHDTWYLMHLCV